jgi:5-(aminomethyl)-3-furanmethanol phosphate kinase
MRVVKLGGSLADWDGLPHCLASLIALGVAIVPGGGPFAEQVRVAQQRWQFDSLTAHSMAIQAMNQYGRMLNGLEPRLRPGATIEELKSIGVSRQTSVWLPSPEDLVRAEIPASWDITSDSLAAWLATQMLATDLILLKSAAVRRPASIGNLTASGVIDRGFARFATNAPFQVWICHRDHYAAIATIGGGRESGDLVRVDA